MIPVANSSPFFFAQPLLSSFLLTDGNTTLAINTQSIGPIKASALRSVAELLPVPHNHNFVYIRIMYPVHEKDRNPRECFPINETERGRGTREREGDQGSLLLRLADHLL